VTVGSCTIRRNEYDVDEDGGEEVARSVDDKLLSIICERHYKLNWFCIAGCDSITIYHSQIAGCHAIISIWTSVLSDCRPQLLAGYRENVSKGVAKAH